jgi:hypothetical protein
VIQVAEPAGERNQVRVAQCLVAEQQDLMVDPGLMDRGETGVGDAPQVDAGDFGTERATGSECGDTDRGLRG